VFTRDALGCGAPQSFRGERQWLTRASASGYYGYVREPPSSDRHGYAGDPGHGKRRRKGWLENLRYIFD
jgi:hypothetical protein